MPKTQSQGAGKGIPRKAGSKSRIAKYSRYKSGARHELSMARGIKKHVAHNPNDKEALDRYQSIRVNFPMLRLPSLA